MKKYIANKFASMTVSEEATINTIASQPSRAHASYSSIVNQYNNHCEVTVPNVLDADSHYHVATTVSSSRATSKVVDQIRNWTKADFMHWIGTIFMSDSRMVLANFALENFFSLNEHEVHDLLTRMDLNDFLKLENVHGRLMYDELLKLERNLCNDEQTMIQDIKCDSLNSSDNSMSSDSMPFLPATTTTIPNHTSPKLSIARKNPLARIEGGKVNKDKKTKDCVHVWQFCRDLLLDARYNPRVIQWLDEKELVFKINDKEEIALLWGKKKNRKSPEKMTYENMSRGMRHSRVASDYFRVPDKKLKKKFVYQFGDKAIQNCKYLQSLKYNTTTNFTL